MSWFGLKVKNKDLTNIKYIHLITNTFCQTQEISWSSNYFYKVKNIKKVKMNLIHVTLNIEEIFLNYILNIIIKF